MRDRSIYLHTVCLSRVKATSRVIISQPEDATWPKNFVWPVLFCEKCGRLVHIHEVKQVIHRRAHKLKD